MDHIVYLNSAAELQQLLSGEKNVLARASMGRKRPYGRVTEGDTLFFASSRHKAKAMAEVKGALSVEVEKVSADIRSSYGRMLSPEPQGTLLKKRYVTIVELGNARPIVPFSISEQARGGPGEWLVLDDIDEAIS